VSRADAHQQLFFLAVPARQASTSDSDSDYGSRSHKKKKSRLHPDEVRISSRGTKVPNYVDDVRDFERFEEQVEDQNGYYVDPNIQYQEEDEIEAVLGHSRDEGREDDAEDLWFENIVRTRLSLHSTGNTLRIYLSSAFISNGKTFLTFITQTRLMSSSSASGASNVLTIISKLTRSGRPASVRPVSPKKTAKPSTSKRNARKRTLKPSATLNVSSLTAKPSMVIWSTFASGKDSITITALGSSRKMLIP